MHKKMIAGNWKMNNTPAEGAKLIQDIKAAADKATCDVVVCTPFVCLPAALEAAQGSRVQVAAQNMHFEDKGA